MRLKLYSLTLHPRAHFSQGRNSRSLCTTCEAAMWAVENQAVEN